MRALPIAATILVLTIDCTPGLAQSVRRRFEAASVKSSASSSGNARIINVEPGLLTIRSMSLSDLTQRAYGRGHSLVLSRSDLVSGGPKWCASDLYDITAKPGGNPYGNGEEVSEMLQSLLAERFKLAIHRESKEVAGYSLVVAADGSKLRPRRPGDGGDPRIRGRLTRQLEGGVRM